MLFRSLELFLIRLSASQPQGTLGELFDELSAMEKRLGAAPAAAPAAAPQKLAPQSASQREAGVPQPAVEEIAEAPMPKVLSLEAIKSHWDQVVNEASAASLLLGTCARDAELASLDQGQLLLRTRNQKQKETLEAPEQRRKLEAALASVLGSKIEVKVLFAQPAQARPKAAEGGGEGKKPSPEEVEKLLKDSPGIKRIQDLFNAEITEVKKV